MIFLLQTINGKVTLDFVFQLERNLEYQYWKGERIDYRYAEIEALDFLKPIENEIPVGTVEFVIKYIQLSKNYIPKPLNVPKELISYRKDIMSWDGVSKLPWNKVYIKSQTIIKSPLNGVYYGKSISLPNGNYQVSKYRNNIISEWRCFIKREELLDCRCYSGDFTSIPDFKLIKDMIKIYGKVEPYTLDVFTTSFGETEILECHRFWSCGLYGFDNPNLAQMFSQGYLDELKQY